MSPVFIATRYDGNSADATMQAQFGVENRATRMWKAASILAKSCDGRLGRNATEVRHATASRVIAAASTLIHSDQAVPCCLFGMVDAASIHYIVVADIHRYDLCIANQEF